MSQEKHQTTRHFLADLERQGIKLWVEGERLRLRAPKGVLSAGLRAEIGRRKSELLAFLIQARPDVSIEQRESASLLLPIPLLARDQALPLSFAQQRLWVLERLEGTSATYNMPSTWQLRGSLEISVLEKSLTEIIRRHEVLRTTFRRQEDGSPVQVIAPPEALTLRVIDLQGFSGEEAQQEVQRLASGEFERPFELSTAPLLRFTLVRLGDREHILLQVVHHIVFDGWSAGLFIHELQTLYHAFLQGKPSPLPELPIQYADFAHWQRQWWQGERLTDALNYWKKQLAGAPPLLELPTDHPRPTILSHRGQWKEFAIDSEVAQQLKELSKQSRTTLFMTLLSAFTVLLARYSKQKDIVVGTVIANRTRHEIESLIGFFTNTLALRFDLSHGDALPSSLTFRELLNQVRRVTTEAYTHQDLPFEKLVAELQPERSLSYAPLFQVAFGLHNVSFHERGATGQGAKGRENGLLFTPLESEKASAKFDLSLMMFQDSVPFGYGEELLGTWEYSTDLFEPATIERMSLHFQTLLQGVVSNPDQPIELLPLLTTAEKEQLLVEWNNTATDIPRHLGIHKLFEAQVKQTPHAVAVVYEEEKLTYQELNRRANQLAHHLKGLGVGPEVLVGICVKRSLDMVVGVLGTLKAGGAYLPLDPHYPPERLAFLLSDAQVPVLLTRKQLVTRIPAHALRAECLCLDTVSWLNDKRYDDNPVSGVYPSNLAYVIYTSGSTGNPKGVMVAHASLCNLVLAQIDLFDVQPKSRLLQLVSFSFDVATGDLFMALCSGATLVLAPQDGAINALPELLHQQAITHLELPASLLTAIPYRDLPALQTLVVGGEVCPPDVIARWAHGRRVFNAYGPTEATICATVAEVNPTNSPLPRLAPTKEGSGEGLGVERRVARERAGMPVRADRPIPIGRPIANTQIYILDTHLQPVPIGVAGELYIGGIQVARGYLNRPELTAQRFINNPFAEGRLYKTGDLARWLPDGNIEFLGRADQQVKIRGFRVELGEIEAALSQHPAVREAVVLARDTGTGGKQLVAYLVAKPSHHENGNHTYPAKSGESQLTNHTYPAKSGESRITNLSTEWRAYLAQTLPDYMIPAHFVLLDVLPRTPNGKIDRRALPAPDVRAHLDSEIVMPQSELERQIATVWQDVLKVERKIEIGVRDNFFDLGGNSLLVIQLHSQLQKKLETEFSITNLFQYPTIESFAKQVRPSTPAQQTVPLVRETTAQEDRLVLPQEVSATTAPTGLAIIGMTCRFPGADSVEEFWENLRQGIESITFFSDEELLAAGVDPETLATANYVKAGSVLPNIELFDANFFGITPREAEILDPQQRLFLERAWEVLESAGYTSENYDGAIGVYAGGALSNYLLEHLYYNHKVVELVGGFQLGIANDRTFLPTRVSYKLNLKGPSVNVQTACSTSLVAVHLACQSLLNGECDIALAGGITIQLPQGQGYLYQEGMIRSPDGHCRPFDAQAKGTVGSNGLGIVVLKRLSEALADGDTIHAIIKGSAINNDGSLKIGYTAPSVEGQIEVIRHAQLAAGVTPESITYVEAHGTGTVLGDPIEVAALTQAFQQGSPTYHPAQVGHPLTHSPTRPLTHSPSPWCAIGSVKSNIGHTDNAAGVAGLIKTVLALKHGQIPPSLHFESPNPKIDFANSPFYVNTELSEWKSNGTPRRAGVSSFGIGGTNAHVILEEAPVIEPSSPSRPSQLLLLSAKTPTALETMSANLAAHLAQYPNLNLANMAYTLQVGRQTFRHRSMVVCKDVPDALQALTTNSPRQLSASVVRSDRNHSVAFMFAGGGAQYVNMGAGLYESEAIFRQEIDRCVELLKPHLGFDLRTLLYHPTDIEKATWQLQQTAIALPALFITQYALAKLWMSWGIQPQAMIGHSLGEYTVACLAGVFSLQDALALVALRGRLFETLSAGAMLSVSLSEEELRPLLDTELSIAAVNTPRLCVVSGASTAIAALEAHLAEKATGAGEAIDYRRIHIAVAAHSEMVLPILEPFRQFIETIELHAPKLPFISNMTGDWITVSEATDINYWVRHLRETVRFADGLEVLLKVPDQLLLEVGPGHTLAKLAQRHPARADQIVLTSLRHPRQAAPDVPFLLNTLGKLWLAGIPVDWHGFYAHEKRHRVPLPTYPFEGQRYWIEPPEMLIAPQKQRERNEKEELDAWFHQPTWERSNLPAGQEPLTPQTWLLLMDQCGVGQQLAQRLTEAGQDVIAVQAGAGFAQINSSLYTIHPQRAEEYELLLQTLVAQGRDPQTIVHLWRVTETNPSLSLEALEEGLAQGFYSLLFLAQALRFLTEQVQLAVVTNNMQDVTGEESLVPEKATVLGPVKVIPAEFPNIRCRSIDVVLSGRSSINPSAGSGQRQVAAQLFAELTHPWTDSAALQLWQVIAYRGKHRWQQTLKPVSLARARESAATLPLAEGGVYLITGGLGGVGLVLAEYLANFKAKIILIGRSPFPERAAWHSDEHTFETAISRKIRKILALEEAGAEVLVLRADVANYDEMRAAITQSQARFGPINGVIHAAGVPGGRVLLRKTAKDAAAVLAAKVQGTVVLATLLSESQKACPEAHHALPVREKGLDFMVLCSSLNSILGGFGQVDYTAANAFLDAFAHTSQVARFTTSINWGTWREVGIVANMVANATANDELLAAQSENLKHGILSHEGQEVLARILAAGLPQVLVSTLDIQQLQREFNTPLVQEVAPDVPKPKAGHARSNLTVAYVAPQDEVQALIANVWQEYLGIETIGIHDHFFEDLAGDSLNATRLISQLQNKLGEPIPIAALFDHPTVAQMGAYLQEHHSMPFGDTLAALLDGREVENEGARGREGEGAHPQGMIEEQNSGWIPLSPTQWSLIPPETALEKAYVNSGPPFYIHTQVDIVALQQAAQDLAARHQALRLRVARRNGMLMQQVHPIADVPFEAIDASDWTEEQLLDAVTELYRHPFDLEQEPPLRLYLFSRAPDKHILLMCLHHIAADGWTIKILREELPLFYQARLNGHQAALPDLPWSFTEYLHWQQEMLAGAEGERLWQYWQQQLSHGDGIKALPVLNLPTDYPRPPVITHRGAGYNFKITSGLTQALRELAQRAKTTPYVLMQAGLQLLLHQISGQQDIFVGGTANNRVRPEVERLVGSLVDAVVLRSTLRQAQGSTRPDDLELPFIAYLQEVRETVLQAFAHQGYPSNLLAKRLGITRQPFIQVSLNYIPSQITSQLALDELTLLTLEPCDLSVPIVGNWDEDLIIGIYEEEETLRGLIRYNTDLFEELTIAQIVERWCTLLWAIVRQPNQSLKELLTP